MTQPVESTTVDDTLVATDQDQSAHSSTTTTDSIDSIDSTDSTDSSTSNSEAARYRVQLRDAQAERDTMAERLNGYQRRECEAVVRDLLDVPSDLWEVGGADLTAFYNEDGTVNEPELLAAASALVELRPRLGVPRKPPAQWGQHSAIAPAPGGGASWGDVINPDR